MSHDESDFNSVAGPQPEELKCSECGVTFDITEKYYFSSTEKLCDDCFRNIAKSERWEWGHSDRD